MAYTLPDLPYSFDALEPHIDAATMQIHHGKHHAAYIAKANAALEGSKWAGMPVEELIRSLDQLPQDKRGVLRNNAGGHANHALFWQIMAPSAGGKPTGELAKAIDNAFGSFEDFQKAFADAGANRFGSGWVWLVVKDGKLAVTSTPNQDNPLMDGSGTPILGLDVWEHAYYLKYQNRRPDYITAWWNVVNWEMVAKLFEKAKG